jgi:hypothetical protein
MKTPIVSNGDQYVKFEGKTMYKCQVNDKQQILMVIDGQDHEGIKDKAKEIA